MMSYSVWTAICVVIILAIASLLWNRIFVSYLKKSEIDKPKRGTAEKSTILALVKPTIHLGSLFVMCSILLNNSDDEISGALNYIRPSKCLDNLLEKMNE